MVAQELGRDPNEFNEWEYLRWFSRTLAENVARMHKAGFIHGYLTGHNITLDCRIVDLDSVVPGPKITSAESMQQNFLRGTDYTLDPYRKDFYSARENLSRFYFELIIAPGLEKQSYNSTDLNKEFLEKYLETLEA